MRLVEAKEQYTPNVDERITSIGDMSKVYALLGAQDEYVKALESCRAPQLTDHQQACLDSASNDISTILEDHRLGYRETEHSVDPSALQDVEPLWYVKLMARYTAGRWMRPVLRVDGRAVANSDAAVEYAEKRSEKFASTVRDSLILVDACYGELDPDETDRLQRFLRTLKDMPFKRDIEVVGKIHGTKERVESHTFRGIVRLANIPDSSAAVDPVCSGARRLTLVRDNTIPSVRPLSSDARQQITTMKKVAGSRF